MRSKQYRILWGIGILFVSLAIVTSLIYASFTTANPINIQRKIKYLTVSQIENITIRPGNPDWKINLTLDTVVITDSVELQSIINIINKIGKRYHGKALGGEWSATMIINFNYGEPLFLHLKDSVDGFFIKFINVMGSHLYYCNDLKPFLEEYTNYKNPVGGE